MHRSLTHGQARSGDRGAALIMLLALILLGLILATLVIDLLLGERTQRMLQRTADAAALAGAVQLTAELTPTCTWMSDPATVSAAAAEQSWREAKWAVFRFLKENVIYGEGGELQSGFGTPYRPTAMDWPPYDAAVYDYPNIEVAVERGIYEPAVPSTNPPSCTNQLPMAAFLSLEADSPGISCSVPLGSASQCLCPSLLSPSCNSGSGGAALVERVANAVRVTLTLKRPPTFFFHIPALFGMGDFTIRNVRATAIASAEGN